MNHRALLTIGLTAIASLVVVGCASSPEVTAPTATATASPSALGAGFWDPANPPAPEATITPEPGSWDAAATPADYTVVLLSFADDEEHTVTLVDAIREWAASEGVDLTEMVAKTHDDLIGTTLEAIDAKPDLIISAGNVMVDPLAALTPSALHQQFLIVGAEIAEPTANVTAVDWEGAGYRGEGLGTPTNYDPATFTSERAGRALHAGVAAVVNGVRGYVIWVS